MKLATWNVNSLAVRLPQLLDWLATHQPDVMVLQETKLTDDKFPQAEIEAAGYHASWFGQKTYNGVALLSKSAASEWLADEVVQYPKLVLLGDFNIAPDDRDVYDPVAWAGQIHCTDEERDHLKKLIALGLVDAFRLFEQPPKSWSWWDYRNLAFRKNQGLRIDLILVSEALRDSVQACTIDRATRKNERPSDHAPVVLMLG